MSDPTMSIQSLQLENTALRQRIAELERDQADRASTEATARQAEAAQRKTAEQLRESQHLAVLGNWEWDLHAQTLTWSDEVYSIFGVTPGEFAPSTEAFESFIHPEDRGDFLRRRAEILAEHRTAIIDHRIIRRDGAVRYVQERALVLTDVTGDASRVIGTVQDITERKRAEMALADREAGLREEFSQNQQYLIRAQQIGHLGNWIWDVQRETLTWSDELYRIFGVSHDFELTYEGIEAMLHPEDRAHNAAQVQQLVSGAVERTRYEFRIIRPGGEVRHIEQSMEVTRDETGATKRVFGIMQDITEHKQIEEALRHSEAMLRATLDAIPESAFLMQPDGIVLAANATVAQRLGVTPSQLIGANVYDLVAPEVAARRQGYAGRVIETGQPLRFEDQRDHCIIESMIYPVFGAQGRVVQLAILGLDITERRQMEERLKESLTLLRIAERAAKLGGWSVELETNRVIWSDEVAIIHEVAPGFSPSVEEGINFYAPEWRERIAKVFYECAQHGVPYNEEMEILTAKGKRVWVQTMGEAVRDAEGKIYKVQGAFQDIRERKQVEQALHESEERLRLANKATNDVIWDWDIVNDKQRWNEAGTVVFGWSDIVKSPQSADWWSERIHPEDRQRVEAGFYAVTADPTKTLWHDEYRFRRLDGSYAQIIDRGHVLRNAQGEAVRMIGAMLDITERKQAEAALRESEEQFRKVFDESPLGMALVNEDFRFVRTNTAFCDLLGYTAAELADRSFPDITHAEHVAQDVAAVQRLYMGETAVYRTEKRYVRKNGEIIWADAKVSARRDEHDQFLHFLVMIENITERKQAEERLTRMTQDLTRSNADLERFASVASHDLREPLRMVGSFVQLLAERYRGQLDADADDYIGFAVDGVQRMERLINDLLEYSRLNTRGEPFRPIDAEAVLAQTLWDLDLTIAEADAVVTHDPLPAVLADPVQLAQLFQNLISNALKFHGAEPPRVHVSHSPAPSSAPCWLFSVRDNGIGIDPKDHTRIFDIFQRLHTREEYPGTGIGLAVCQRIVERHGGRIWVESQVGQGTTFFFTLPTP